jgi:hypothetical protein
MIVGINEILPHNPMFCQSLCNGGVAVTLAEFPPSAKVRQDKEHDRSGEDSHNHKDSSDSPLIPEEALDKQRSANVRRVHMLT